MDEYLTPIRFHLKVMKNFKKYERHLKLYRLARQLTQKGYFLNAITLLDEAIGFYCAESFKRIDPKIERHIESFLKSDHNRAPLYEVASTSKSMVKMLDKSNPYLVIKEKESHDPKAQEEKETIDRKREALINEISKNKKVDEFLKKERYIISLNYNKSFASQSETEKKRRQKRRKKDKERLLDMLPEKLKRRIENEKFIPVLQEDTRSPETLIKGRIIDYLKKIENLDEFQRFIENTDSLRNNLAHANSSDPIEEVKLEIENLLEQFDLYCLTDNVLQSNNKTVL